MLSPGQFHALIPKDRDPNLALRQRVRAACADDPRRQALVRDACRQDILFYINLFVFQYNPNSIGRGSEEVGPFVTWDFQDAAVRTILDCIDGRHDLVIEKSREMGASWLCLLVMDWLLLFHPWKSCLVISRSEHAVFKAGDPNCLFWKLDFIHEHLPSWLGGAAVHRRKLSFVNEDNRSTIIGEASTGKAGVGGRAKIMFIDEFSQIEEDFEVYQRTSDTAGCRIFNGTHVGTSGAFYQLTDPKTLAGSGIRKLRMHWTQHPDKRRGLYRFDVRTNEVLWLDKDYEYPVGFEPVRAELPIGGPHPGLRSPWYDEQCSRKGSARAVAQDLDIDAGGSVSQFFNALTIRTLMHKWELPPVWRGDVVFDRATGRAERLLPQPNGPILLWVAPKAGPHGLVLPFGKYGAACDLAAGTGATNSVLSVADALTGEKVLEYATPHMPPNDFAPLVTALCWLFTDEDGTPAKLCWEIPGPGLLFGKVVLELGYRHVYRKQATVRAGGYERELAGWQNSNDSLRLLLDDYCAALRDGKFINHSKLALEECLEYRWMPDGNVKHNKIEGGNDPTGARTNHGDRTIADALCWKMVKSLGIVAVKREDETKVKVCSLAWRRQLHDQKRHAENAWN